MYKDGGRSFVELCLDGDALTEEVDDFIDKWHESTEETEIYEFLGMDWDEYSAWVAEPGISPLIITAHAEHRPLVEILEKNEDLPLAARADDPEKAKAVLKWLKAQGKLD